MRCERSAGNLLSARTVRPPFWRLFQVRLAADGVSYFTVRGLGERAAAGRAAARPRASGGVDRVDDSGAHGDGQ